MYRMDATMKIKMYDVFRQAGLSHMASDEYRLDQMLKAMMRALKGKNPDYLKAEIIRKKIIHFCTIKKINIPMECKIHSQEGSPMG